MISSSCDFIMSHICCFPWVIHLGTSALVPIITIYDFITAARKESAFLYICIQTWSGQVTPLVTCQTTVYQILLNEKQEVVTKVLFISYWLFLCASALRSTYMNSNMSSLLCISTNEKTPISFPFREKEVFIYFLDKLQSHWYDIPPTMNWNKWKTTKL